MESTITQFVIDEVFDVMNSHYYVKLGYEYRDGLFYVHTDISYESSIEEVDLSMSPNDIHKHMWRNCYKLMHKNQISPLYSNNVDESVRFNEYLNNIIKKFSEIDFIEDLCKSTICKSSRNV